MYFFTQLNRNVCGWLILITVSAGSKQYLIFNEELLVVLCFIGFTYINYHYFNSVITGFFSSRGLIFENQLHVSLDVRVANLRYLVHSHITLKKHV
jgi:hypothetical protein